MPSAAEFTAAANSLAALAESAVDAGTKIGVTADQTGLEGDSEVESRVRGELESAKSWLSNVPNSVGEAITEIEWRASVCMEYAMDMERWRAAVVQFELVDDGTGVPPPEPEKPYPWVEE